MHPMKQVGKRLFFSVMLWVFCSLPFVSFAQTHPAEDLFKAKCAMCHGPDGAAQTTMGAMLKIRALGSADVQKQTDADLNRIITKGKNKMPAFESKLKKEQIDQLVSYVRQLAKKQ